MRFPLPDGIDLTNFPSVAKIGREQIRRVIKRKQTRGQSHGPQSHDGKCHDGGGGLRARVKKQVADLDTALRHEFLTWPSQARQSYTMHSHNTVEISPDDNGSKKSGGKDSGRAVRG